MLEKPLQPLCPVPPPPRRRSHEAKHLALGVHQSSFLAGVHAERAGIQSSSMDRGLQGLGVVGTFISYLIKVGTPGQGLNAEWEVDAAFDLNEKAVLCNGV